MTISRQLLADYRGPADVSRYDSAMAGATWRYEVGCDGLGQASFRVLATGAGVGDVGGLEVYLDLGRARGADTNGWTVTLVQGAANGVVVTPAAKTIAITHTANATLANVKTAVDVAAHLLESRYYGGQQAGASIAGALDLLDADGKTINGHEPVDGLIEVQMDADCEVVILNADNPPLNAGNFLDSELTIVPRPWTRLLPAGHRCFVIRGGGANIDGSMAYWKRTRVL